MFLEQLQWWSSWQSGSLQVRGTFQSSTAAILNPGWSRRLDWHPNPAMVISPRLPHLDMTVCWRDRPPRLLPLMVTSVDNLHITPHTPRCPRITQQCDTSWLDVIECFPLWQRWSPHGFHTLIRWCAGMKPTLHIISWVNCISASKLNLFFVSDIIFCHSQVGNMEIGAVLKGWEAQQQQLLSVWCSDLHLHCVFADLSKICSLVTGIYTCYWWRCQQVCKILILKMC